VDDSLTADQGGSGLGLSIADRLIRGLGGRLDYRDRAGGGATFTLHIPFHTGEHT
jgi:signal transduction histidine kinase